jgi:hypothetical protein
MSESSAFGCTLSKSKLESMPYEILVQVSEARGRKEQQSLTLSFFRLPSWTLPPLVARE